MQESQEWQIKDMEYRSTAETLLLQRTKATVKYRKTAWGHIHTGTVTAEQKLMRLTLAQKEKRIVDIINELHHADEMADIDHDRPSKVAARVAKEAELAAMELQLVAAGRLSPFAVGLRQQREEHRLAMERRPSMWVAEFGGMSSVMSQWDQEEMTTPGTYLTAEVR